MSPSAVVTALRAAGCVFAEDEARLLIEAAGTPDELAAMLDRRVAGLPLEHVLGWAEFCGLRIAVEPGVFVPRRRTGFLARSALTFVRPGAVVVDLCCGSGAVGAALASWVPEIELHATDIDPVAVRCARRNLGSAARVYLGDLDAPLPSRLGGRVDVLVANAPYVPTGALGLLPAEARVYEPHGALDGGVDGLDLARRVVSAAPGWLAPGGAVLVETSGRQAPALAAAMEDTGLTARLATSDELNATVAIGVHRHSPRTHD
jgi:release factor glutamine methyltransferase